MRELAVALALAVFIGGCSKDNAGAPTTPSAPVVPAMAGNWRGTTSTPMWTLQVLRVSDNFQKAFTCTGTMTFSQTADVNGIASLSGFAVVGSPCAPTSFDLSGTVDSTGVVTMVSGGPPPTEGPCPGATGVSYSGQVAYGALSLRGVTTVQCPDFGAHVFTYLINATKY